MESLESSGYTNRADPKHVRKIGEGCCTPSNNRSESFVTSAMSYTFWGFLIMSPGSGSRVLVLSAMRPFTCNSQIVLHFFLHMQYVGRNGTAAAWALFYYAPVGTCAENSD